MTKLCDLLGSQSEVMYECMYTTHKTQKRKIWHDGFVMLYSSRKIIVYADDEGKAGKVIDETKWSLVDWDCKDEEHIETSKDALNMCHYYRFLVEIVNETPVDATSYTSESVNTTQQSSRMNHSGPHAGLEGKMHLSKAKVRTSVNHDVSRQIRPARVGQGYKNRNVSTTSNVSTSPTLESLSFDFARNPTSDWNYVPNAINRTRRILH
ncbi:hypothetical protein DD237_004965 [Peronospora effusa]|uniref:5'-3' DNA helicase ZGRF1-like N-terminal domain-containing protein n=1 Tax=Peronospora effusa TaxID=542832 RepID=A0A3R7XU57_9STRA|nr:hypothetical protein DD237_004965 [Peronospora effusa]